MNDETIKAKLRMFEDKALHLSGYAHEFACEIAKMRIAIGKPPIPFVYMNVEHVGTPLGHRYPTDSYWDKSSRSVHDMIVDGKNNIHFGSGNQNLNTGDIEMRILTPDDQFEYRGTIREEAVYRFSVVGGDVWIAGPDARQLRNCSVHHYSCETQKWRSYNTIKAVYHLNAFAKVEDRMYVISTRGSDIRLWQSIPFSHWLNAETDWEPVTYCPDGKRDIVCLNGELYLFCATAEGNPIHKLGPGEFNLVCDESLPGETSRWSWPWKVMAFQDREIVYGSIASPSFTSSTRKAYAFDPLTGQARVIWKSRDRYIFDIQVYQDTMYIMSVLPVDGDKKTATIFNVQIHKSSDLEFLGEDCWVLVGVSDVPGIPFSFVVRDDNIFIGLGCRYRPQDQARVVSDRDRNSGMILKMVE